MRTYVCTNSLCLKEFQRYPSQVRNEKRVFCSKKCLHIYQSGELVGENNPNYKDGKHAKPSICSCGREKDYRANRCSICARVGFSKTGEKLFSEEDLKEAVLTSSSYIEAASKLGITRSPLARHIEKLELNTNHMKPGRGRNSSREEIFSYTDKRRNGTVRKYLRREEDTPYECSECNLDPTWNGKPLTLHLDHKNGDPFDNRKVNLRWLCPNCHTQTPTYTGRNSRKKGR